MGIETLTLREGAAYAAEGILAIAGIALMARWYRRRQTVLAGSAPAWPGTALDAAIFLVVIAVFVFLGRLLAGWLIARFGVTSTSGAFIIGVFALDVSCFAGTGAYHWGYKRLDFNRGGSRLGAMVVAGGAVFLTVLPVVLLSSGLWQELLKLCHYPISEQGTVDIFLSMQTIRAKLLFTFFAVVAAPMAEEIVFRGVIYRELKRHLPRWAAIWISALLFGSIHMDLSYLVPLTLLGAMFALAYDATGAIGVTMIAHALVNLNTLAALLLGLTQ